MIFHSIMINCCLSTGLAGQLMRQSSLRIMMMMMLLMTMTLVSADVNMTIEGQHLAESWYNTEFQRQSLSADEEYFFLQVREQCSYRQYWRVDRWLTAKFRLNHSYRGRDISIFYFISRWRQSAILNLWCVCWDHPRKAFGGLYLLFVCLFVRLRISPSRIKLSASNFARRFIGFPRQRSPIFGNFAPPEAQNRTNRPRRPRHGCPEHMYAGQPWRCGRAHGPRVGSTCVDIRPFPKTGVGLLVMFITVSVFAFSFFAVFLRLTVADCVTCRHWLGWIFKTRILTGLGPQDEDVDWIESTRRGCWLCDVQTLTGLGLQEEDVDCVTCRHWLGWVFKTKMLTGLSLQDEDVDWVGSTRRECWLCVL